MTKRRLFSFFLLLILLLNLSMAVGCNKKSEKDSERPTQTDGSDSSATENSYTLLVYICGSDLESRLGEASKSIAQMQQADFGEHVNVIVQTGGTKKWSDPEISASSTDRYLIKNGEKQLIDRDIFKKNFGESDTLIDFIKFGVENYPAKKTSLILWDHGGGSVKGVCFDANFGNDSLTLPEIKTALESTSSIVGKWEFIGFDACLMATYDTACTLSPFADYMIASEELEPSSGWDYKTLVSRLGTNDFYESVLTSYAEKQAKKSTYTLSVIKLSELGKATEVIEKITDQINYDLSFVGKALAETKEFGSKGEGSVKSNLFDLGLIAKAIGIEYDFSSFIENVNGMTHEDASGMSLYFPTEKQSLIDEYSAVCQNENYIRFLNDYLSYVPETTIEFCKRGYDDGGKLSFTVSKSSEKYIRSVGYELRADAKNDKTERLYCVGTDNDVLLNNGVYTVDFKGNWVFLNDSLLHCNVYEETGTYTVFSAMVKVNGEFGRLLLTYIKSANTVSPEGYTIDGDVTSRVNDITEGTQITVIYEDDHSNYIEEATVIWNKDAKLSVKKLDVGNYQYIPYIVDIYGSVYTGVTATVYFDGEKVTITSLAEG